jgi:uncharacterized membrane protein
VTRRLSSKRFAEKTGRDTEPREKREHAVRNEVPADRGIRDVAHLERLAMHARSPVDRVAAAITRWAGSARALVVHTVWFGVWIIVNAGALKVEPFDPFPFSLLTTIVSLEAIFLTLFVLISQNRMSHEADRRAELDLQINLLAEKEATMVLRILRDISSHLGLKGEGSKELRELLKETKIEDLADKLDRALPTEKA